jgi:uncharacterized protein (DUF952 family)
VNITYHGCPTDYFDLLDPDAPYVPPGFEGDGFIHCTDGEQRLSDTLSAHYADEPGDWLVLYIDKDRVQPPIKYEDPERVFPHIHGPLNRDAIEVVCPIMRTSDGRFLLPQKFDL